MKETRALLLVGVVIAAALTGIAVSSTVTPLLLAATAPSLSSGQFITGHVELIQYDANGNIKGYWQTDNIVVNEGDSCAADRIFNDKTATGTPCSANNSADFLSIGIGNGSQGVDNSHDGPGAIAVNIKPNTAVGLMSTLRDTGASITNSTGAGAVVTIATPRSFTFEATSTASDFRNTTTVTDVFLFDTECVFSDGKFVSANVCSSASDAALFAEQVVSVTTTDGDTLAVTWTITVGG